MFKRLGSVVIITALVFTLGGTSAFANKISDPNERTDLPRITSEAPSKEDVKRIDQLKHNMLKLVADAKAGKVAPAPKSQNQSANSNNWSKKTKIVVGVGIAVTVVVLILVVNHARNHFFDDFHPFQ
jgi:hypothetical protein